MEGVAWRDTEQVTTLVSLSLQGELGLPGPPGVPGLIVSTQMPGGEWPGGRVWGTSHKSC